MSFWSKDNKIIVKNSKLVNCDNCPCSTMDIQLSATICNVETPQGPKMYPCTVSINIKSGKASYSGSQTGMGVAFYNVPSDYPITGEIVVSFPVASNSGGITGFYGQHEGAKGVSPEDPNDQRNQFMGFKCTFEITKDTPIWFWPLTLTEVYKAENIDS